MAGMDKDQQKLWRAIENLRISVAGAEMTFLERLQDENGWSTGYTERVVAEYKRFLFLCAVAGHPVTPSEQVDQAWHLHLTYTYSYWGDLCAEILGFPLHHGPTKGGTEEKVKYKDQYQATLVSYQKLFEEEPPMDIWPATDKRFNYLEFRRINLNETYALRKPQLYPYRLAIGTLFLGVIIQAAAPYGFGTIVIIVSVLMAIAIFFIRSQRTSNEGSSYGCSACNGCGVYDSGCGNSHGDSDSGCGGGDSGCSGCGGCGGCGGCS